jgi:hypothetical protein
MSAVIFGSPRGTRARPTLPRQKRKVYTDVTISISPRTSVFKEEAECCALFVYGLGTQVTPAFLKYIFFIQLKKSCHALCTSDVCFYFFTSGATANLTQTKSACTAYVRPVFFAGGKRRPAMPVVRARLIPRRLPPQTPVRLLGLA